jgi:hypothetical protein
MKRTVVEDLLGEPDYSPVEGQYYYSSDRKDYVEAEGTKDTQVTIGLVIDYRDNNGVVTEQLQTFQIGPIGE